MNVAPADLLIADITGTAWMGERTGGQMRPTRDELAQLAYQRYACNGRKDGNDVEDWLLAERELAHHYA